jgi:hypothetical protein
MCPVAGCGTLLGISDLPGLDGGDGAAAHSEDGSSSSGSSSGSADVGSASEEASESGSENSDGGGSSSGGDDGGSGTCTPGATQCMSDTQVETCNSNGQWGTAVACSSSQTCAGAVCCLSWALGGVGVPAGTVATAASGSSPANAIDGNLSTSWNSGGYTGSISLQFPTPQAITGIRIAAQAGPGTNETYAVMTLADADSGATMIGSATEMVNTGTTTEMVDAGGTLGTITIEPAIPVTPGAYAGITINVNGMASWVEIVQVSLLTVGCP